VSRLDTSRYLLDELITAIAASRGIPTLRLDGVLHAHDGEDWYPVRSVGDLDPDTTATAPYTVPAGVVLQ
jgi:hypothetical protein